MDRFRFFNKTWNTLQNEISHHNHPVFIWMKNEEIWLLSSLNPSIYLTSFLEEYLYNEKAMLS